MRIALTPEALLKIELKQFSIYDLVETNDPVARAAKPSQEKSSTPRRIQIGNTLAF